MDAIYFYAQGAPYGEFSNFSPYGIEMDGRWWPTVEHYFQAQKFLDEATQEKMRAFPSPKQVADMGRSRKLPLRSDWEKVKDNIMYLAVKKKISTHDRLKELLLDTEGLPIIENARSDYYWGCGQDGTGLNKLGKILERVRAELREEAQ